MEKKAKDSSNHKPATNEVINLEDLAGCPPLMEQELFVLVS